MQSFTFASVGRDIKAEIARNSITTALSQHAIELTPNQYHTLEEMSFTHLDYLLDKDISTSPGARNLQTVAQSLVSYIAKDLFLNKKPTTNDVRNFLDKKFDEISKIVPRNPMLNIAYPMLGPV
jgi:hypothetical protein